MEMIATTTIHLDQTSFLTISPPPKMQCSLKNVSFSYNLNQKQHAMFMLARHMLLSHDNLTLIELFLLDLVEMHELVRVMSFKLY